MNSNTFLQTGLLVWLLCLSGSLAAQNPVALTTQKPELQTLSETLKQRDVADRHQARQLARGAGIPMRRELPNGRVLEMQRWKPGRRPVFYLTYNVDAADTVSTDEVWPGGSAGLSLTGNVMTIGLWDGGAVFGTHDDLAGRVNQVDGATEISGHATHVAGTLIGDGGSPLYPQARGMAYVADLDAYDWLSDTAEMAAAAAGDLLISNHSYGIAAGWIYTGAASAPDQWWWIGGAGNYGEDPNFGYYDSETAFWDEVALNAPYYLIVKAAGNDRTDTGPAPGEAYTVVDESGNSLFIDTAPRVADCAPAGFDCLPTVSVAKNVLTVGAVDDVIGGYSPLSGPAAVNMTSFSSWGPTDDGRIKPDVVGNGEFLLSTYIEPYYFAAASGTSMAAPNVSGSLLLIQEHHQNLQPLPAQYLRAATLKALAIHTADETGEAPGPDYSFGWGLVNTKKAADVVSGNGGSHQVVEGILANGGTDTYPFTVSSPNSVLKATLVWADPPGTPAVPSLDPTDSMLVNDLDLRVTLGLDTFDPWVLDPAAPGAPATRGDNVRDNVEQVVAEGDVGNYSVQVSHKGVLSGAEQPYSLIISEMLAAPVGGGLLIDEDFSVCLPPGWSIEGGAVVWSCRPQPGDSGVRYDNDTGGTGNYMMVDVNYPVYTVTSLVMPPLDLSAATGAVLRFKSHWYFDLWETFNVDVSTNGGGSWTTAWSKSGFALPSLWVLELSGVAAGEADVRIRFRFDSVMDPVGNFWKIDDVELETFGNGGGEPPAGNPPGPASSPNPVNGGTGISVDTVLSWTAGSGADSHDVYFGTDATPDESEALGNQSATTYDPGTLAYETTYYWRIDGVNADGTTTGATWNFTTEAAPPPPAGDSVHLAGLWGSKQAAPKGRWNAWVEILVHDQGGTPEPDVTVEGAWSNGANGSSSCATDAEGRCSVQKSNLKNNVASVLFTITSLVKDGHSYALEENTVPNSVVVSDAPADLAPVAFDDSYQTPAGTPMSANVMVNDDPGDGPASVNSHSNPVHGVLEIASDGSFTYTPNTGFTGMDTFSYSISDSDGDTSNTATVTISVGTDGPSPFVSARPFKVKGVQHVELAWRNFPGDAVDIYRDGNALALNSVNDGSHEDNIGAKGGGSYLYEVCETDNGNCENAIATF